MMVVRRRGMLAAAAGTLLSAAPSRKPFAASLPPISGALVRLDPPQPLPEVDFQSGDGTGHTLAEFKGHGMVVNLWATWCVPCVAEMPSLEALSKALAPRDIAVMPLSSDRRGAEAVRAWYAQHGITALPVLLDPHGAVARGFNARGIPTTVVVNRANLAVARLEGAADWAAPEAQALIQALVG